jgi:hypothetical protein
MAKAEGKLRTWKHLKIKIVYSRSGGTSGWATYSGYGMLLRLEKPSPRRLYKGEPQRCFVRSLVHLTYHELMHSYGYRHKQYGEIPNREILQICENLGLDHRYQLPEKTEKPKRVRDLPMERYNRICDRTVQWEKKAKRAATALKKLRKQKREYERRLRAAGKLTEETGNR